MTRTTARTYVAAFEVRRGQNFSIRSGRAALMLDCVLIAVVNRGPTLRRLIACAKAAYADSPAPHVHPLSGTQHLLRPAEYG